MIAFFQLPDGFFPYIGFALVVLLESFVGMAKKLSDFGFVFRSVELFFKLFVQRDWFFDRVRAFREIHHPLFKLSKWHAFQLGLFLGLLNKKSFASWTRMSAIVDTQPHNNNLKCGTKLA